MALSPRQRWQIEQLKKKLSGLFGGQKAPPRPKICPACGSLVGTTATRCHQCGASLTFSLAAASKSLSRLMPATSPMTYGILTLSCVFYFISLLWTVHISGLQMPSGGIFGIFNLGAINGEVLQRLGASLPMFGLPGQPTDINQPWRLVMAVFLHASIVHIGFNMWVLMDVGPVVEELYGSARYLFIYVATGIAGYILSGFFGHVSIGGSGALLGLIGVLLALTVGRRTAGMQMLRTNLIKWLIYIAVLGFMFPGIDNLAHIGGFVAGFILGRIMTQRPPSSATERKQAYALGWAAGLAVALSIAVMVYLNYRVG